MRVFFQIDPIDQLLKAVDTSLLLAWEAYRRGYEVICYPWQSLVCRQDAIGEVQGSKLVFDAATRWRIESSQKWSLDMADIIIIRQNPPVDMAYITTTYMLEIFLNQAPHVRIFNHPSGIRDCAEKLVPFSFADLMPPTLISKDSVAIEQFCRDHGDVVVKPLYGYGGHNLVRIGKNDTNHDALLELFGQLYREPVVIQKYLPEVRTQGDRRIFLVDGVPIGGFVRIPPLGDIRANTIHGSRIEPLIFTPHDEKICARLGPYLREKGLFLAGLDIIDGYLMEVNVTSPGGFYFYDQLHTQKGAWHVWEAIERGAPLT